MVWKLKNIYHTIRKEALLEISEANINEKNDLQVENSENKINEIEIKEENISTLNIDIEVVELKY